MSGTRSYLNANLAALGPKAQELTPLLDPEIAPEVEVHAARTGEPSLAYKGVLLHSRYDPRGEAQRFAERSGVARGDYVFLYGFGLGYQAEAVAALVGDEGQLVVLELNRAVLSAAFHVRELGALLSRPNVWVLSAASEHEAAVVLHDYLTGVFGAEPPARQRVLIHTPLLSVVPEGHARIVNALEVIQLERSAATVHRSVSMGNLLANLDAVVASPGAAQVLPVLDGQPAFLVSAGPSLDEALPHLAEFQDRAWILTVDTVYEALRRSGVAPDFVVSIDPQLASAEHFAFDPTSPGALVFLPTSARTVVERFPGRRVVAVQTGHSIVSAIEDLVAAKGVTASGGSAACVALDLAVRYGVGTLFFVGQDCGFPDWKVYSANLTRNRNWVRQVNRFMSLEVLHRQAAAVAKLVYVPDRYGAPIPTHQSLYSYLRELERIVEANSGCTFYNFFSRGASIRGVRNVQLVEEVDRILPPRLDKRWDAAASGDGEALKREILGRLGGAPAAAAASPSE
jgi:hypothetical protein